MLPGRALDAIEQASQLGFTLTAEQVWSFYWLEACGLRFLAHYGVMNCVTMANSMVAAIEYGRTHGFSARAAIH